MNPTEQRITSRALVLGVILALATGCSGGGDSDAAQAAAGDQDETGGVVVQAGAGATQVSSGTETTSEVRTPVPTDRPQGPRAPDFNLTMLDGTAVRLSDFAGEVVLIDFWATWCGPCKMSVPHLIELQNEYGEQGFTVFGVSVDRNGSKVVKDFVAKTGINYPVAMGNPGITRAYGGPNGIQSIPTMFLVDRDGYVATVLRGYRPKSDLEKLIGPLLAESTP